MSWKGWLKLGIAAVLAPVTSTTGVWAVNTLGGVHIPFNAGTILLPAIPVFLQGLLHLFQTPPHQS